MLYLGKRESFLSGDNFGGGDQIYNKAQKLWSDNFDQSVINQIQKIY